MTLGERLRISREKRELTQLEVANLLNISNTVLSNYERDYRDPDSTNLKALAELYRVSTDYLLGVNQPKEKDKIVDKDVEMYYLLPEKKRRLVAELIRELSE